MNQFLFSFFLEEERAAVSKSAAPQKMTISVKGAAAVDPESGEKIIQFYFDNFSNIVNLSFFVFLIRLQKDIL